MTNYDNPWKETLEVYFAQFLLALFPEIHRDVDWGKGYEFLDKELEKIDPDDRLGKGVVDKLVKVWLKDGREKWLLLHIEIQSQEEAGFAFRMYVYHSLISLRYNQEVVSLAVLGDDRPGWRPNVYLRERWGFRHEFRFPIVKLLDCLSREAELSASQNPVNHIVLAHLRAVETTKNPDLRRSYKFQLVRNLYEVGFGVGDVRQLFRLIDWMMTLPVDLEKQFRREVEVFEENKHMPYVTSIERLAKEEGIQEGMQRGVQEGMQRGVQEGIHRSIEMFLQARFGEESTALALDVRQIDSEEHLQRILRSLAQVSSLDELKKIIQNPS